jgi:hypothetical protein
MNGDPLETTLPDAAPSGEPPSRGPDGVAAGPAGSPPTVSPPVEEGARANAGGVNLHSPTPSMMPPPPPSVATGPAVTLSGPLDDGLPPDAATLSGPIGEGARQDAPSVIPPSMVVSPPPPPRPKPVIIAERVEDGWRTDHVLVDCAEDERGFYVTVIPQSRGPLEIYLSPAALDGLIAIAASGAESGKLWRALSDIPLERPLPSRALEEELRVLLTTFANELRLR